MCALDIYVSLLALLILALLYINYKTFTILIDRIEKLERNYGKQSRF